ncbi:MAG: radical SAM protein, partial [Myxococcota bacterium]
MNRESLEVTEIFRSIQGESTWAGHLCIFVRLARCNLRCSWCDTRRAFQPGREASVDELMAEVERLGPGLIELTGGEPLLQPASVTLMERLLAAGRTVLLETNGTLPIGEVPRAVHKIVDLKAPGSGESEKNLWENLELLSSRDEIKIVLAGRADYEWARDQVRARELHLLCRAVTLSPVHGAL